MKFGFQAAKETPITAETATGPANSFVSQVAIPAI
jgi:hypothetical protein